MHLLTEPRLHPPQVSNAAALSLYERFGFIRDKRLHGYYMSNQDAFRLKLLLPAADEDGEVAQTAATLERLRAA